MKSKKEKNVHCYRFLTPSIDHSSECFFFHLNLYFYDTHLNIEFEENVSRLKKRLNYNLQEMKIWDGPAGETSETNRQDTSFFSLTGAVRVFILPAGENQGNKLESLSEIRN